MQTPRDLDITSLCIYVVLTRTALQALVTGWFIDDVDQTVIGQLTLLAETTADTTADTTSEQ